MIPSAFTPRKQTFPGWLRRRPGGFSLMELLVVVVIVALVAALATPSLSSVLGSLNVSRAGQLIQDHLLLARQLAMTQNTSVVVSFCEMPDESGKPGFNTLLLSQLQKDGTLEAIGAPLKLSQGTVISPDQTWSTIMTLLGTNVSLRNQSVPCHQFRFDSDGATSLSASGTWCLTVYDGKTSAPDRNFVTLAIDPVTGRIFSYQP